MSIQRQRGNNLERRVAKELGTVRQGQYGAVDVATETFAVECKERQSVPKWLKAAIAQAVGHAQPDQLPVVWLHELGARHDEDVVMIKAKDFKEWFGS